MGACFFCLFAQELCSENGDVVWENALPNHGFRENAHNDGLYCDLRYQGQIEDRESGLYYNVNRYYDADSGQYLSPDPIGFSGGLRPQAYVFNPLDWIGKKPLNSPDPIKWVNEKGGTVWNELDGTWVYQNSAGTVVRYPNGYPDFSPYVVQEVGVPDLKGNHSRGPSGDFGKANAKAPLGAADLDVNIWHHHEGGITMQEVPKDIHKDFTHRGGISKIKNSKCS